jgi:hypothetical protein
VLQAAEVVTRDTFMVLKIYWNHDTSSTNVQILSGGTATFLIKIPTSFSFRTKPNFPSPLACAFALLSYKSSLSAAFHQKSRFSVFKAYRKLRLTTAIGTAILKYSL